MEHFAEGSVILIDGKAWTVSVATDKCSATRDRAVVHFARRWVVDIGEGLFTLEGRLTPSGTSDAVAETAAIDLTT